MREILMAILNGVIFGAIGGVIGSVITLAVMHRVDEGNWRWRK